MSSAGARVSVTQAEESSLNRIAPIISQAPRRHPSRF
jgi:hypothetical protein